MVASGSGAKGTRDDSCFLYFISFVVGGGFQGAAKDHHRRGRLTCFAPRSRFERNLSLTSLVLLSSSLSRDHQDPILGVSELFHADKDPSKMLLGTGAYRDDNGKPLVLECVRKAEKKLIEDAKNMEYLPTQGDNQYISRSLDLAYGKEIGNAGSDCGFKRYPGRARVACSRSSSLGLRKGRCVTFQIRRGRII